MPARTRVSIAISKREANARAASRRGNHERPGSSAGQRRVHLRPHRPAAGDAHDLDDHRPARLRHVLRALRPPVLGLCRAEPGQVRPADRHDRRPVRHDRGRKLHRRPVHRPFHRHDPVRLSRRPVRPAGDLHLVAALVLGGEHHGGAAERRRRPQSLALRLRRRAWRRDRDHRRLSERARAEGDPRPRLRGQPGDRLRLRAGRLVPRLAARADRAARARGLALGGADRGARRAGRRLSAPRPAGKPALARQARPARGGRPRARAASKPKSRRNTAGRCRRPAPKSRCRRRAASSIFGARACAAA